MRRRLVIGSLALFLLGGCGGGGSSSGSSSTSTNTDTFLSWPSNDNNSIVLDAAGNKYVFSTSDGCMALSGSNTGPANFCLTVDSSSSTGFANYGPTNCSNPSSNSSCNSSSFDVLLTYDPQSAVPNKCIAVLANGGATATTAVALSVTSGAVNNPGFEVTVDQTPTAYPAYWNGYIAVCNGPLTKYAGSYTLSISGNCGGSTGSISIDSAGIVNNDASGLTGNVQSNGTGKFDIAGNNFEADFNVSGVTLDSNNQQVFSGSCSFVDVNGVTNGNFTLTQSSDLVTP